MITQVQTYVKELSIKLYKEFLEWFLDLYLYYIKGIEDGPRIEKRMAKFQKKFERMMKRRGIALIVQKTPNDGFIMSFVNENVWEKQREKIQDDLLNNLSDEINREGDVIEPTVESVVTDLENMSKNE